MSTIIERVRNSLMTPVAGISGLRIGALLIDTPMVSASPAADLRL